MVSDIAHELRGPLTNIRGYLEAAEDGVVPLDRDLLDSLIHQSATLERLVDDLQDLALADAGRLRLHAEPIDAAEIVGVVGAAHHAAAEAAGISLEIEAEANVPVVADPHRLQQAVGNLTGNAIRYTRRGGRVTLSALVSGDAAVITVRDTGVGIADEHLPHIFERFYRADASRSRQTGGSGLGLAITKYLVEAHGGTIEVSSQLESGSTFVIRLPESGPTSDF
jgi:two-component system sensor histidine kinase BaeS